MGRKKPSEIMVKVVQLGAPVREVALEPGSVAEDALEAADMPTDLPFKLNGDEAELDTELEDGDRITLGDKVKGQ